MIEYILQVPKGRVASYGQIAAMAGSPRAALIVGQILKNGSGRHQLPWQRVINSKGYISIVNMELPAELQAELLKGEGVEVEQRDREYWVDMNKYGWQPDKLA